MCMGAEFQIFLASLLKVDGDRFVLAVSGTISAAVALVSLSSSSFCSFFYSRVCSDHLNSTVEKGAKRNARYYSRDYLDE